MRWIVLLVLGLGCKGKSTAPATGSGSMPSVVAVVDAAVAVDAAGPTGKLEIDTDNEDVGLALAFDKHVPKLPAISADGNWIADLENDATGPGMMPFPFHLALTPLDGTSKPESLAVVDDKLVDDAMKNEENWSEKPPSSAVQATLRKRGEAAMARLTAGNFTTLEKVDVPVDSSGTPQPAKIGAFTLTSKDHEDSKEYLEITLRDGNKSVRTAKIEDYSDGQKPESFEGGSCTYRPMFDAAYVARQRVYVAVRFRFHEECSEQPVRYVAWTLPSDEETKLFSFVVGQFEPGAEMEKLFVDEPFIVNGSDIATESIPYIIKAGDEVYTGHEASDVQVVLARDGKSAWASFSTLASILPKNKRGRDDPWRASSVLVNTQKGWRIAATTWTQPVANAKANADAKSGKLKPPAAFTVAAGDETLRAAFAKLLTDGLDADALARPDLVAFGSGPGERTVGGAVLARGWNGGWKGKAILTSTVARVAPSGTTGWVVANVELPKGSYKIPFQMFAVFDKTSTGQWTLVHLHFSV